MAPLPHSNSQWLDHFHRTPRTLAAEVATRFPIFATVLWFGCGTPAPEPVADTAAADTAKPEADTAGVKAPGNLPQMTQGELDQIDAARKTCIEGAGTDEAKMKACHDQYPVMQVEVVPDPPLPPG